MIDPVAFTIGPIQVHWYGIMYLIGFIAGWWLGRRRAAQPGSTWKPNDVDDLIFFAALGVILGGRIGWVIVYGHDIVAENPLAILKVLKGDLTVFSQCRRAFEVPPKILQTVV